MISLRKAPGRFRLTREIQQADVTSYHLLLCELAPAIRAMLQSRAAEMGWNATETEALVQDVLLTLHHKRHTRRPAEPVGPWLAAIVEWRLANGQTCIAQPEAAKCKIADALKASPLAHRQAIESLAASPPEQLARCAGVMNRDCRKALREALKGATASLLNTVQR